MRLYIIIILLCCLSLTGRAQVERYRNIYEEAETEYNIGRIAEAHDLLKSHIGEFPVSLRISGYRLLSLSCLALDETEEAEKYVHQLLDISPYYSTTLNDPQRFVDMVENIKAGLTATITTASSQAEKLNEVPVPTTLITEEMIRNSSARNLQEVLATYVPGMNIVDCNDDINIAMRGVYSNGQEKILIMLNGHRLNSFATNIASPDFSMSLDKVRQIEVLRGPASSLYGGVSLTAVVNVITKQGIDVDGVEARVGAGNYGQLKGGLLFGKRYFDLDMLVWGSLYKAKGEKFFIPSSETGIQITDGDITIGGIGPKPSYDAGLQLKYKNLQFLYALQFSQVISPFTQTYTFSPYNLDKYRTFNGISPSFATLSHHADLSYQFSILNSQWKATFTYDNSDLTNYQVVNEPEVNTLIEVLPVPDIVKQYVVGHGGISRYLNGQEYTLGGKVQGDWCYINNDIHRGLITIGAEYSYFRLDDCRYAYTYDFDKLVPESDTIPILGKGHESNLNGFVQLKHHWNAFILNVGLRFDHKNRYDDSRINELSPRLALIYVQPKWNLKLSYSKAFIDAPYMYRKTNLFLYTFMGIDKYVENLRPEVLHSYQLTFGANQWLPGLNFEVNGFYNKARDLIFYQLTNHYNTGISDTYGIELSARYERRRFSANLVTTWQDVGKEEMLGLNLDYALNTPVISANAVLAWQATDNLKLRTHVDFQGLQHAYYMDIQLYAGLINTSKMWKEAVDKTEEYRKSPGCDPAILAELEKEEEILYESFVSFSQDFNVFRDVPARVVFDVGATWRWRNLTFDFDVKNLFNRQYRQSGMSTRLVPQRGRWFLGTVTYKF